MLDREDSGEPDAPIVCAAFPGEEATLSGKTYLQKEWFVPVTDPAVLIRVIDKSARANLMQADLAAHGITDLGRIQRRGFSHDDFPGRGAPEVQLRIDGERMVLAR